jgi:hypothetical protein
MFKWFDNLITKFLKLFEINDDGQYHDYYDDKD